MKEPLKQAIQKSADQLFHPKANNTFVNACKIILSDSDVLRHCDPEIMKQAGWVKIEDILKFNPAMAEYYMQHNYREMYAIWERIREEITPLQPSKR